MEFLPKRIAIHGCYAWQLCSFLSNTKGYENRPRLLSWAPIVNEARRKAGFVVSGSADQAAGAPLARFAPGHQGIERFDSRLRTHADNGDST